VNVAIEFDLAAEMRDGTVLRADVYRPVDPGPWPTLLVRTPYDKTDIVESLYHGLDPAAVAGEGFVVVVQDARGRGASEGSWRPLVHDAADGVDTIAWAAGLAGSNGRVGMLGGSYSGHTQWLPAARRPAELGAISPTMTWADPMDGFLERGGAIELGWMLQWALAMGLEWVYRTEGTEEEHDERAGAIMADLEGLDERGYWDLPVSRLGVLERSGAPTIAGAPAQIDPDGAARITVAHDQVDVPSLHTTGWYDLLLQGTLDNYAAMAARERPAQLIVGPWTHTQFEDPVGERSFGLAALRHGMPVHPNGDWAHEQLAFFRRNLTDGPHEQNPLAPVRIFVMGRNEWRDEEEWPPARAVAQRWFLGGDGGLTAAEADAPAAQSTFTYDPADPAPTLGGHTVLTTARPAGPVDQRPVEAREDVLVFTSDPLEEDLEVTGRVRVVLYAASSARSTDWVARLCDVDAEGRSFNVCDGIIRIAAGADAAGPVEIDLWSTSNVFLAGHRLRVDVTSSSFPRWDRNLNSGDQHDPSIVVAEQTVHHGAERPSWIELPVIASEDR
jgi:uncharacterized protein